MTTYIISEPQGCYKELHLLLEKINYNKTNDQILFTGNYTNNNKNSIQILNLIRNLGNKTVFTLGKNELLLLELINNKKNLLNYSGYKNILQSKNKIDIINWIQYLPLMYYNEEKNYIIVHAGIYPFWDIKKTIEYTKKIESVLRTPKKNKILKNLYNNNLNIWNSKYNTLQKYQFIINTLTNMTICNEKGYIKKNFNNTYKNIPKNFKPWFMINNNFNNINIFFGNWKELFGKTNKKNIIATNTGATWGLYLSAINIETKQRYYIKKI